MRGSSAPRRMSRAKRRESKRPLPHRPLPLPSHAPQRPRRAGAGGRGGCAASQPLLSAFVVVTAVRVSVLSVAPAMLFELVPHSSSSLPPLPKPFIRANAKATVRNIRKLIVQLTQLTTHDDTQVYSAPSHTHTRAAHSSTLHPTRPISSSMAAPLWPPLSLPRSLSCWCCAVMSCWGLTTRWSLSGALVGMSRLVT
jgi:hypothetical protein